MLLSAFALFLFVVRLLPCGATDAEMLESYLQATYPDTSVTSLKVDGLEIGYIDAYAFSNYTSLTTLEVKGGNLSDYSADAFRGIPLTRLTVRYTHLTHVPVLVNYTTLTRVWFTHNMISTVDRDAFFGTPLVELRLSNNLMTCLPDLGNHVTLVTLWMDSNDLGQCANPPGPLTQVTRLYLNSIPGTNMTAVYRLAPNLQHLTMMSCELTEIPASLPVTLQTLTMTSNKVTGIVPGLLATLPVLYALSLNYNELADISAEWFVGSALTYLSLDKNALRCVPDVRHLADDLLYLKLSDNNIRDCTDAVTAVTYARLNRLYVEKNQLTRVPEIVYHAPILRYLHLAGNYIYAMGDLIATLPLLVELNLEYNPLVCACVHKWIKELGATPTVAIRYDYVCPLGNVLSGLLWTGLGASDLCQEDDCGPGTQVASTGLSRFVACRPSLSAWATPMTSAEGATVLGCAREARKQNGGGLYYNQQTGQCDVYSSPVINQTHAGESEFYSVK